MEIKKINIDGKEYKVGGGKLYKHLISIMFEKEVTGENGVPANESVLFDIEFITESETPITQQQFVDYINNYPYKQFSGTYFYGKFGSGVISNVLVNNNYGNYNFQVERSTVYVVMDGIVNGEHLIMNLGTTFGNYIIDFTDKVTPFITEV